MLPNWFAVCLIFSWEGPVPDLAETRVGMGHYAKYSFLHARAHVGAPAREQPVVGATNPTVPLGPMRQFLRCVP